ncbi:MAG: hypothetical protein GF317_19535 [Candidatus Lokiarchaeota archaeon]|nr:hypothetical protein [Candidatus Lokiarchaeota archaeon]MBD3201689.1 hypothetical protein [Candidatus Lokiarchaeota archaeon]
MQYIKFFSECSEDLNELGGKGSNLIVLCKDNLNVPPGFILTTKAYKEFLKNSMYSKELMELMKNDFKVQEVLELSKGITSYLRKTQLPHKITIEIENAYQKLLLDRKSDISFAVRSSATIEDLDFASFAGQANSYLYQNSYNDIKESIKKCWISLFSPSALLYISQMKKKGANLSLKDISMAVIIQLMVFSEISGVMFTANVLNGNKSQILINSNWGLGETIADNKVVPDTLIIDKDTGEVIKRIIGRKEKISIPHPEKSCTQIIDSEKSKRDVCCLSSQQIDMLRKIGVKIEDKYNYPQDIEWAIMNDNLYILQTRPITTLK